jgi:hypothetical protein
MAFLIKLGSMTIVAPTACEAVDAFDKFVEDSELAEPLIRTLDGAKIDIERLRGMAANSGDAKPS